MVLVVRIALGNPEDLKCPIFMCSVVSLIFESHGSIPSIMTSLMVS